MLGYGLMPEKFVEARLLKIIQDLGEATVEAVTQEYYRQHEKSVRAAMTLMEMEADGLLEREKKTFPATAFRRARKAYVYKEKV